MNPECASTFILLTRRVNVYLRKRGFPFPDVSGDTSTFLQVCLFGRFCSNRNQIKDFFFFFFFGVLPLLTWHVSSIKFFLIITDCSPFNRLLCSQNLNCWSRIKELYEPYFVGLNLPVFLFWKIFLRDQGPCLTNHSLSLSLSLCVCGETGAASLL